ncbi:pyrimidine 5'-nucleotidase [Inquilinus sp.]|uniref:pyrimidine 5'-nucleotidase n=1 Tax=Inquilinus sp. TaxID=1932117 RepID=UPI0031DE0851
MTMPPTDPLRHVEHWVFDLDNTLYPARTNLFAQIDRRMGEYIREHFDLPPDEARALQKRLFRDYGTTLNGLMREREIDPGPFLEYVHDIDISAIGPSPALAAALGDLPGRKIVFTNGSVRHAERVLTRLGVVAQFDGIFDIVAADYVPKPDPGPYRTMLDRYGLVPASTVMVEDMARNLLPAHRLGMTTVWVRTPSDWGQPLPGDGHIDIAVDDTAEWLAAVAAARRTI